MAYYVFWFVRLPGQGIDKEAFSRNFAFTKKFGYDGIHDVLGG